MQWAERDQSPPREAILPSEPTTPRHQGIPDPLLNPPGAPCKSKAKYSWSKKPREDFSFLRGYFDNLPPADSPTFAAAPHTLEQQFERAWRERRRQRKCHDSDLVPRLAGTPKPGHRMDEDEAESPHPTCFSCGSTECPAALLPSDCELDFEPATCRRFSSSAPLPQLHLADDDSPMCSGGERRAHSMGPPRRKRPRTMSQQSLTHMLRLRKTSPPPPGTPCKQHWLRAAPHSPYLGRPCEGDDRNNKQ